MHSTTAPHALATLRDSDPDDAVELGDFAADAAAVRETIARLRRRWSGRAWFDRMLRLAGADPSPTSWDLDDADRVAVAMAERELVEQWGDRYHDRLALLEALATAQAEAPRVDFRAAGAA